VEKSLEMLLRLIKYFQCESPDSPTISAERKILIATSQSLKSNIIWKIGENSGTNQGLLINLLLLEDPMLKRGLICSKKKEKSTMSTT